MHSLQQVGLLMSMVWIFLGDGGGGFLLLVMIGGVVIGFNTGISWLSFSFLMRFVGIGGGFVLFRFGGFKLVSNFTGGNSVSDEGNYKKMEKNTSSISFFF